MGEIRVSLPNFLTVGLMAFVFLYIANRLLIRANLADWKV